MFKEKVVVTTPKKDDVVVNMVLAITTPSQILKKPLKNKSLADWQEEEKLQCLFEEAIKGIQQRELLGASIKTLVKRPKNFV